MVQQKVDSKVDKTGFQRAVSKDQQRADSKGAQMEPLKGI